MAAGVTRDHPDRRRRPIHGPVRVFFAVALGAWGLSGHAQTPPPAGPGRLAVPPPLRSEHDQVIGSVDGRLIYLSDLARVSRTLPDSIRALPFDTLMPVLLDRMIDHEALILTAQRAGLDKDPAVQREMRAAADQVLENAWLRKVTAARVTEAEIENRYKQRYANRPPTEEVRASHILLGTEAEADAVLAQLKAGADFAAVARAVSKDPDGANGGDLGFFRRDQVWPGFADTAFALRPGQISQKPIHNEFGWHIVKVEDRRLVPPASFPALREQLRQEVATQAVLDAVANARGQMVVRKFNLDGTEQDPEGRLTQGRPE